MTKRAILYARVSGDDRGKDGRNLASQLEMCREYALEQGYTVVAELQEDDRGASGASFELPQLNYALEMAQRDEGDVFVVRELDRLSRNLAKQLIVEETFSRYGVGTEYVLAKYDETPEGQLQKLVRASVAEYERLKINERMARGRRNKVKSGKVMTHGDRPPYGYRLEDNRTRLVIYEPEARIVRLIFQWYTEGDETGQLLSTLEIAKKLTGMQVPTWGDTHPLGYRQRGFGQWAKATISKILKNSTYAGVWSYGKRDTINVEVRLS